MVEVLFVLLKHMRVCVCVCVWFHFPFPLEFFEIVEKYQTSPIILREYVFKEAEQYFFFSVQ